MNLIGNLIINWTVSSHDVEAIEACSAFCRIPRPIAYDLVTIIVQCICVKLYVCKFTSDTELNKLKKIAYLQNETGTLNISGQFCCFSTIFVS